MVESGHDVVIFLDSITRLARAYNSVQSDGAGGSFVMVLTDPETQEMDARTVEVVASDGLTSVVKGQVKAGDEVVVGGGMGGAVDGMGMAGDGGMAAVDAGGSVMVG